MRPFPSPLETDRLIIRTPQLNDAAGFNEAILETWDGLHLWMPWAVTRPGLKESLESCQRMSTNTAEQRDYTLFCFEKKSSRFVLASGAHPRNLEVPSFEIGYWCRETMQGRGFVTEAVQAISEACFQEMGARRIEIRCDKRNLSSLAVAERCGFRLEGEFKNDMRDTVGALRTTLIYALTRDDSD